MQLYDITIATNTTRQLDAPGSYFYYYSGSAGGADSTITLRGVSSGLRLILKPGQAFRLPTGDVETSWILTNYANTSTIIGTVMVGDGDITDNRVTGSVEVIDGGKNRTLAKTAFMMKMWSAPVTAQYSHWQLWNPINSGKNLFVEKFFVSSSTGSVATMQFGEMTAQIATLDTTPKTKNFGSGASSVAQGRVEQNISLISVGQLGELNVGANQTFAYEFKEPIMVPPATGFGCRCSNLNTSIMMSAEFFEENI